MAVATISGRLRPNRSDNVPWLSWPTARPANHAARVNCAEPACALNEASIAGKAAGTCRGGRPDRGQEAEQQGEPRGEAHTAFIAGCVPDGQGRQGDRFWQIRRPNEPRVINWVLCELETVVVTACDAFRASCLAASGYCRVPCDPLSFRCGLPGGSQWGADTVGQPVGCFRACGGAQLRHRSVRHAVGRSSHRLSRQRPQ